MLCNWTGLDWTGLDWTGLDWTGLDWTGLDWTGLDWTGLDWTGLDWTGLVLNDTDWYKNHLVTTGKITGTETDISRELNPLRM